MYLYIYLDTAQVYIIGGQPEDPLGANRRAEWPVIEETMIQKILKSEWTMGPSIYDVHMEGEGVRLRWTHVDGGEGVKPHVDVHTEN